MDTVGCEGAIVLLNYSQENEIKLKKYKLSAREGVLNSTFDEVQKFKLNL